MSKRKGKRRERQAREILESLGYYVETPNATQFQREDFFGLFDIIAIHPERKPLLIQVKSNRAADINDFTEKSDKRIPEEYFNIEFWVCHDGEGWRVLEVSEGEYEVTYDERDKSCNMGDGVKSYKSPDITDDYMNNGS